MSSRSSNEPTDDLDDEVTVAANSNVVDEIRRRAAERKAGHVDAVETDDAGADSDLDDDEDITVPAPPMRSTARRAATPVGQLGPVDEAEWYSGTKPHGAPQNAAADVAAQDTPSPQEPPVRRAPKTAPTPKPKPVSTPVVSPFADDDVSLIEQRPAAKPKHDNTWEPPTRFVEDTAPSVSPPRLSFQKLAILMTLAIVATAVITAVVVLALAGGS